MYKIEKTTTYYQHVVNICMCRTYCILREFQRHLAVEVGLSSEHHSSHLEEVRPRPCTPEIH